MSEPLVTGAITSRSRERAERASLHWRKASLEAPGNLGAQGFRRRRKGSWADRRRQRLETRIQQLVLAPGMVRVRTNLPNAEARLGRRGPRSPERAPAIYSRSSRGYYWVPNVKRAAGTRGICRGWNDRMRWSFSLAAARIEWPRGLYALITLTYPELFSAEPADWAEDFRRFVIAWERRWGEKLHALWAREFQRRGAPHYHLAAVLPKGVDAHEVHVWMAETWYKIAGHGDIKHLHQHLKAGHFEVGESHRALFRYLKRELGKGAQKTLPSWLAGDDNPRGAGRWWGKLGFEYAEVSELVTFDEYQMLRRAIRRLLRQRGVLRRHPYRQECLTLFEAIRARLWRLADEIWYALRSFRARAGPRGSYAEMELRVARRSQLELGIVAA